jgi:hypothetical protein
MPENFWGSDFKLCEGELSLFLIVSQITVISFNLHKVKLLLYISIRSQYLKFIQELLRLGSYLSDKPRKILGYPTVHYNTD